MSRLMDRYRLKMRRKSSRWLQDLRTASFPNQEHPWSFSPAQRSWDGLSSNIASADFTGIFMGDVSGNWPGSYLQSSTGVRLEIDGVTQDGVATVNIMAGSASSAELVSALELQLITSSQVSLLSVERTAATDTPIITTDGYLRWLPVPSQVRLMFLL